MYHLSCRDMLGKVISEKPVPDIFGGIVNSREKKEIRISDVIRICDMSEPTFYRRLREY